jgi:signal transduction histidine kinase
MNPRRPLKFSIFFKLILLVILFVAVIDVAVLIVIRLSTTHEPGSTHRAERVLISLIGSPPDTVLARKICTGMSWQIRYQSSGQNWSSSDSIPTIEQLSEIPAFKERFAFDSHFGFMANSKLYLVFNTGSGVFVVQPAGPRDTFDEQKAILILVVLLSLIILSLYYLIRRLFDPLKLLMSAVHDVGKGNYYLNIPVNRKDELGELASSISSMASNIGNSIKAKEQLLLDVSHELRTPLTRIKLGLEVDSPKEKINDDIFEMETMISGLLESYREESAIDSLHLEQTDIVELLKDTQDEYIAADRIVFDSPGRSILLNIDEDKIQSVFRNIISNGLKYSTGKVEISIEEDPKNVRIKFKDSGIGISKEDLPYIFEPFYRADQSRSRSKAGFGLGLSICKKIMDAHRAVILVNSTPNAGSEFTLVFNKLL